jgi:hypothetical protein
MHCLALGSYAQLLSFAWHRTNVGASPGRRWIQFALDKRSAIRRFETVLLNPFNMEQDPMQTGVKL